MVKSPSSCGSHLINYLYNAKIGDAPRTAQEWSVFVAGLAQAAETDLQLDREATEHELRTQRLMHVNAMAAMKATISAAATTPHAELHDLQHKLITQQTAHTADVAALQHSIESLRGDVHVAQVSMARQRKSHTEKIAAMAKELAQEALAAKQRNAFQSELLEEQALRAQDTEEMARLRAEAADLQKALNSVHIDVKQRDTLQCELSAQQAAHAAERDAIAQEHSDAMAALHRDSEAQLQRQRERDAIIIEARLKARLLEEELYNDNLEAEQVRTSTLESRRRGAEGLEEGKCASRRAAEELKSHVAETERANILRIRSLEAQLAAERRDHAEVRRLEEQRLEEQGPRAAVEGGRVRPQSRAGELWGGFA